MKIGKDELTKEEGELLTGLALRFGVGVIPEAVEAIKETRQSGENSNTENMDR